MPPAFGHPDSGRDLSEKDPAEGGRHEAIAARGSVHCICRFRAGAAVPDTAGAVIVPFSAGGSTDIAMRSLAAATEKHLGQPIVIENKTGAGGTIGPASAANARPDGYTVAQLPITVFRTPFIQKTPFDPTKDFTYIIHLTGYTFGIVVKANAPWKTFEELLDYAKANPGKLNYGTPGAGSSPHITMEQIAKMKGFKWTHVPFKGVSDNLNALLGGHIDVTADSTGWAGAVDGGQARLLVTWGAQRTENWPNVPTLREAGIDIVSNSPFGIGGPKGMDPAVVKILHDAFRKGMQEQSFKSTMAMLDQEEFYLNSADYHAFAMKQIGEQKQVVEDLGLRQQ
jgi:tripartite-type tricarboxylate transporter receptor subunit TctC